MGSNTSVAPPYSIYPITCRHVEVRAGDDDTASVTSIAVVKRAPHVDGDQNSFRKIRSGTADVPETTT
jgi:hypothetical protein